MPSKAPRRGTKKMRRLIPLTLLIGFFLLGGCQEQNASEQTSPYLMGSMSTKKTVPAPSLEALRMAHEEKLARIEAEKAEALKRLEMERSKNIEAVRARTREIEAQKALELAREKEKYARLVAEKEERLKTLEAASARQQADTRERIARLEAQSREKVETLKGEYAGKISAMEAGLKNRYLIAGVFLIVLLLIVGTLLYRYRRRSQLRERQEEREHELRMLANRQQHERIEKILEVIAAADTDKEVKAELIRLLQQGALAPGDPRLIEYKNND